MVNAEWMVRKRAVWCTVLSLWMLSLENENSWVLWKFVLQGKYFTKVLQILNLPVIYFAPKLIQHHNVGVLQTSLNNLHNFMTHEIVMTRLQTNTGSYPVGHSPRNISPWRGPGVLVQLKKSRNCLYLNTHKKSNTFKSDRNYNNLNLPLSNVHPHWRFEADQ